MPEGEGRACANRLALLCEGVLVPLQKCAGRVPHFSHDRAVGSLSLPAVQFCMLKLQALFGLDKMLYSNGIVSQGAGEGGQSLLRTVGSLNE